MSSFLTTLRLRLRARYVRYISAWAARRSANRLFRMSRSRGLLLALVAIPMGLVGGFAGIAIQRGVDLFQTLFYGTDSEQLVSVMVGLPIWMILLVPTFGGLCVGLYVHWFMGGMKAHGVPQVMAAAALGPSSMPLKQGFHAALLSCWSLGCGASVGREGPAIHLGASLASAFAHWFKTPEQTGRTLLAAGVAAAVAASFNAPLAGMFFAIEVIVGHYTFATMAPIVIASVVGTAISRAHFGNYPAFEPPGLVITSLWELPAFALLGVLAGVAAYLFVRAPFWTQALWQHTRVPAWLRPAAAGLFVGIVAIWLPKVMGVGYEGTNAAIANELSLSMLVLLTIAKLALTGICLGSGFVGGVFSPSLFVGATLGAAFGVVAAGIFPELASSPGLYALAGMGAVAAAVIGSPMSTVLMVFEITANFEAAIAVMIAVMVSSVLFWEMGGRSLFKSVLMMQGIDLDRLDADRTITQTGTVVAEVMRTEMTTVSADCRFAEVRSALLKAPYGVVFVIDQHRHLLGTITNVNLPLTRSAMELKNLTAWELMERASSSVSQHACVADTLKQMEQNRICHLPVIDDGQGNHLIGFVHERDVIDLYFNALQELPQRQRGRGATAGGGIDTAA